MYKAQAMAFPRRRLQPVAGQQLPKEVKLHISKPHAASLISLIYNFLQSQGSGLRGKRLEM